MTRFVVAASQVNAYKCHSPGLKQVLGNGLFNSYVVAAIFFLIRTLYLPLPLASSPNCQSIKSGLVLIPFSTMRRSPKLKAFTQANTVMPLSCISFKLPNSMISPEDPAPLLPSKRAAVGPKLPKMPSTLMSTPLLTVPAAAPT